MNWYIIKFGIRDDSKEEAFLRLQIYAMTPAQALDKAKAMVKKLGVVGWRLR